MRIKKSFATRSVSDYTLNSEINATHIPKAGDVGIFEVLEINKSKYLQCNTKVNMALIAGDWIQASFGARYATSQFEGYVPDGPVPEVLDLLGGGGVVGVMKSKNAKLKDKDPTKVKLVGYCCKDDGTVINTHYLHEEKKPFTGILPFPVKIFLSIGSSMDSGKTTTAAYLTRGFRAKGHTIAYIKLTGTAFAKDADYVYAHGAEASIDFSWCGFPSTFLCSREEILDLYQSLLHKLIDVKPEYIVMEIADGILQRETNFLLKHRRFMETIHSVVLSTGDSLSAIYGIHYLAELGIKPAALCGLLTMSDLLISEVKEHTSIPVLTIDMLKTGEYNHLFTGKSWQMPSELVYFTTISSIRNDVSPVATVQAGTAR